MKFLVFFVVFFFFFVGVNGQRIVMYTGTSTCDGVNGAVTNLDFPFDNHCHVAGTKYSLQMKCSLDGSIANLTSFQDCTSLTPVSFPTFTNAAQSPNCINIGVIPGSTYSASMQFNCSYMAPPVTVFPSPAPVVPIPYGQTSDATRTTTTMMSWIMCVCFFFFRSFES